MTRFTRPSLDRLEYLLAMHDGGHIDCHGCDLAAECIAMHRLRAMLTDELGRLTNTNTAQLQLKYDALVEAVREYKRLFESEDADSYDAACTLFATVQGEHG